MAEFKFVCPFCNRELDCDESLNNQITVCPICNNEIIPIPNPHEGKIKAHVPESQPDTEVNKTTDVQTPFAAGPNDKINIYIQNSNAGYNPQDPGVNTGVYSDNTPKKRWVYILLGFFLGSLGVHNFYAGYSKEAIAQLVVSLLLFPVGGTIITGVWALANIICRSKDAKNRPMIWN